jgi:HEAT repeat protein
MDGRIWQLTRAAACIAAILVGGLNMLAASEGVPDEAALIGVLKSDAGWQEKLAACRALRQIGTPQCIPALAALLPNEQLSHMARYALEPMPYPEAGQSLRDALVTAKGAPRTGIVISLGVRRDGQAVPLLVPLLKDPDKDLACAAAGALGRIATPGAVTALLDSRRTVSDGVRPALAEGLLASGQRLVQDGNGVLAAPVFEELLASRWPMFVRVGAFHGLASADPEKAPEQLIEALKGKTPEFRDVAAEIIAETSGPDATALYAKALRKLPKGGQVALLRGLADRKDPAARLAVVKAAETGKKEVRLAALKALGGLGGAEDVAWLAKLLNSGDAETTDAAKASLTVMRGEGVGPAIAAAASESEPAVRAQLLELMATRRAKEAIPLAVASLGNADASVRVAGLRVLDQLGGKDEAPVAVNAVLKAADDSERAAAEKALTGICSRGGNDSLPVVLAAMNEASSVSRVALLRAVGQIGGPEALKAALAALKDPDQGVSAEAVRVLSNWTTLDAVPHLLELAKSDDLSRQVLALRGYVRLAGIEPSAETKAQMLTTAMGLAKRPDEKKLVLGAWGSLPTEQSLNTLRPYLDDAAVRNEAASAIIAIAPELAKDQKTKPQTVDALKAVVDKCENAQLRNKAQEALGRIQ